MPPSPNPSTSKIPLSEQKDLLRNARQQLHRSKVITYDNYKDSLRTAHNAIQCARMLQNMSLVLDKKKESQEPCATLESELDQCSQEFQTALRAYDKTEIFNIEGKIENLTLRYDPKYLEFEEQRRMEHLESKEKLEQPKPSWASNTSSRLVRLLKGDLEGTEDVTEEDQRSCISKCAWIFAIIGLIVAIAFLIADFWYAQAHPAITTRSIVSNSLQLPVVYGCLNIPFMPTFMNMNSNQYKGNALWGLRSLDNTDANHSLKYPDTKLVAEEVFLGDPHLCPQKMQGLSRETIALGLNTEVHESEKCYSCLKFGGRTPLKINRERAITRPAGAVTLEFASSVDLEYCLNPFYSSSMFSAQTLLTTIREHAEQMVERGIIEIIAAPSVDYALMYGFEDFKTSFPNEPYQKLLAQGAVVCNLYLFSGYFFPVQKGKETRYSFDMDGGLKSWRQLGNRSNFLTLENQDTLYYTTTQNREQVMKEMMVDNFNGFIQTETSISMYAVDNPDESPGAFKDYVATLRQNHRDVLFFTKQIDNGLVRYSTRLQLGMRSVFAALSRFRRYNISLDFQSFETEIVTTRPTTSTPEFLTDVFEYIGLFTGICAYSVLVGPARIFMKRNKNNEANSAGH